MPEFPPEKPELKMPDPINQFIEELPGFTADQKQYIRQWMQESQQIKDNITQAFLLKDKNPAQSRVFLEELKSQLEMLM